MYVYAHLVFYTCFIISYQINKEDSYKLTNYWQLNNVSEYIVSFSFPLLFVDITGSDSVHIDFYHTINTCLMTET